MTPPTQPQIDEAIERASHKLKWARIVSHSEASVALFDVETLLHAAKDRQALSLQVAQLSEALKKRCTKFHHEPQCNSFVRMPSIHTGDTNDADCFGECDCAKNTLSTLPSPSEWVKRSESDKLRVALDNLLNRHVSMVSSGDCGNFDVELDTEVIAARKALASTQAPAPIPTK